MFLLTSWSKRECQFFSFLLNLEFHRGRRLREEEEEKEEEEEVEEEEEEEEEEEKIVN